MVKDNIIKKEKPNMFAGLNTLTKWFNKPKKDYEEFRQICKHYGLDKQVIKRIISYAYNSPNILIYINKYMNQLYDWNSYDFEEYIKSIVYIFSQNELTSKKFNFVKSSEYKDENRTEILDLFDNYFKTVYNEYYSDRVLRTFYELYLNDVILLEDIIKADKLLHNGTKTLRIKDPTPLEKWETLPELSNVSVSDIIEREKELKEKKGLNSFISEIKSCKINRTECKSCSLFSKPIVVLDSNLENENDSVDVILIGLNPGAEEAKMDQPFTEKGKSGSYIRKKMTEFPEGTKWLITNSILCSTKDKKEIDDIEQVSKNCRGLVDKILNKFTPKLFIPIGSDATKLFDIEGNITKISGKYYEDKKAMPIIHPSGMRGNVSKEAGEFGWKEAIKKINELNMLENIPAEIEREINPNEITNNDMLFDVFELSNDEILLTFIDDKGNKKYITKENELTSYIKEADFRECSITTTEVDSKFTYSKMDKFKLLKTLRGKLNDLKQIN